MDSTVRNQKFLQPLRKTHVADQLYFPRLYKKGWKVPFALLNGLKCVTNVLKSEFKYCGTVSLALAHMKDTYGNRGQFKILQVLSGFFDKWPENEALKYKMKDIPA